MLHVLVGENDAHDELEKKARARRTVLWVVPKRAVPGDDAAFFLFGQGITGVGKVLTSPEVTVLGKAPAYSATVGRLRLFSKPIRIDALAKAVPDWKWTTYPRTRTTVSATVGARLSELFSKALHGDGRTSSTAVASAAEGMAREGRVVVRARSGCLRRAALERAGGVCEACGVDFSKVLDGDAVRILHVHHVAQLALARTPQVTTVEDLAVVCPNCHSMLHIDPKRTMSLDRLRALLARR